MKELTVRSNDAGQRLDRFVGKAVPLLPETLLQKYIRLKRIKLNGKGARRDTRLEAGDLLQLYINDEFFEKPREENSYLKVGTPRLNIVYEDENILLLDKKPGVLCHSAGQWDYNTLIANVQAYMAQSGQWNPREENSFAPALCNRIDRNTGGIVIAAKNAEALRIINDKIRDREISKFYLCAVRAPLRGAAGLSLQGRKEEPGLRKGPARAGSQDRRHQVPAAEKQRPALPGGVPAAHRAHPPDKGSDGPCGLAPAGGREVRPGELQPGLRGKGPGALFL